MRVGKVMLATAIISTVVSSTAFAGTWKVGVGSNQNKWWYDNGDGTYAKGGWQWIDGNGDGIAECYCFDNEGWMYSNTTTPDNYQVNADGAWITNGSVETKIVSTGSDSTRSSEDQNQNLAVIASASLSGTYVFIGSNQNGVYQPRIYDADATLESITISTVDDNTVKAVLQGMDVNNSSILLKNNGDSYVFVSGELSAADSSVNGGYFESGNELIQYIKEMKVNGDTITVTGEWEGRMNTYSIVLKR